MTIRVRTPDIKRFILLLLPTLILLFQWIDIGGLKASWALYVILFISCVMHTKTVALRGPILAIGIIVVSFPLLTFKLGIAEHFNTNLYFSLLTGFLLTVYVLTLYEDDFNCFLKGCVLSCFIFSLWGIYEIFTGNYIFFNTTWFLQFKNMFLMYYPGVVFSNPNDVAQYLTMLYPLAFLVLEKRKMCICILGVLSFFVIMNSESRISMICFVISILLIYSCITGKNKRNRFLMMLGVGLVMIVAIMYFENKYGLLSNITENFLSISKTGDYYTGREIIYSNLIQYAFHNPFGGFGSAYVLQSMPPHNLFLYILCDFGIVPCILFCVFIVSIIIRLLRCSVRLSSKSISIFMIIAIIFPIMACASSCNEQRKIVWLVMSIIYRVYRDNVRKYKNPV